MTARALIALVGAVLAGGYSLLEYQPVTSSTYTANVVAVVDGDTVMAVVNGEKRRLRLAGIDAPERNQAYGAKSRAYLSGLVLGKSVLVHDQGADRYGRIIAELEVTMCRPAGNNCRSVPVNLTMVRAGSAWVYRQYTTNVEYRQAEDSARGERTGLWAAADPVPPWDFRHAK